MNTFEGATTYSAEDYLHVLNGFLAETAEATRTQQQWMRWGRGLISDPQLESCDRALSYQIRSNVEAATAFIQELGSRGLSVMVNVEERRQPLQGLGFDPQQGDYNFGVLFPDGPRLLLQSEAVQLDILPTRYA